MKDFQFDEAARRPGCCIELHNQLGDVVPVERSTMSMMWPWRGLWSRQWPRQPASRRRWGISTKPPSPSAVLVQPLNAALDGPRWQLAVAPVPDCGLFVLGQGFEAVDEESATAFSLLGLV